MNRQQLLSRLAQRGWPVTYSTGALSVWERGSAQWKAAPITLTTTIENGKKVYSRPHQAKVVTDSQGTELFLEYKGRKVADV